MKTTREHISADRYTFDFNTCSSKNGFAQLDTKQDAWYYGVWINPTARKVVSYCEGDLTVEECASDEELTQLVKHIEQFHNENSSERFNSNGKAIAIDPGFNEDLKAALVTVGLEEYIH